ncbi:MFS transporter [bacterium]|nr:MFS transporter [bacterium]
MSITEKRWHILFALLLGVIMGPIDVSIVNINLPVIADYFSLHPSQVVWVSISYLFMLSTLLLPFGKAGDIIGFKKLYLRGLLIFIFMSLTCGLSLNFTMLVISRGLQALGAGITMALAPAIITAVFPSEERGRALGLHALAVALGLAIGPSLGGFLSDNFGWRSIFLINIPIGVSAYYFCSKLLPEFEGRKEQPDYVGTILIFFSLLSLLLFISNIGKTSLNLPLLLLILLSISFFALFIRYEKIIPHPLIDLTLFKNPIFSLGLSCSFLNYITQYIIIFSIPFYLQKVLFYPASKAGLIMTTIPLTILLVAPFSGWISDKIGHKIPALTGLVLCTISTIALAMLTPIAKEWQIIWRLALYGLGTGVFQSPNNSAIMGSADRSKLGIAGAILATIRNLGMVLGLNIASTILSWLQNFYSSRGFSNALYFSLRGDFIAGILFSFFSVLLAMGNFLVKQDETS